MRDETVIVVTFVAVTSVGALVTTSTPRVLPVACQTSAVLPAPAGRKVLAPFRLGFADLAVFSERFVHWGVSDQAALFFPF